MRSFRSAASILILSVPLAWLAAGCVVVHDNRPVVPATCQVPGPVTYTTNFELFHILGNAATAIPGGDRAYAVTSNGNGTYRLTWSDTAGFSTCFTGRITGLDAFNASQVTGFSGAETIQLISPNQIGFASVPNSAVDGVDFFAQRDPIYVDVYADGSPSVNIYYTDGSTSLVTATGRNPVAFSSP
jgi:hypothetical protein